MARRKIEDQNIRSLSKVSNGESYAITLPVEVIRRWRWREHQKLELKIDDKNQRITIKDWER